MTVEAMIETLIGKEGGYSNHPSDTGGETMWGITIAVARANGYQGPMRSMPRDTAKAIYRSEYFVKPGFATVAQYSPKIAEELFDTGVNMGQSVPSTFLQRLLNALNRQGKDYPDIAVDGQLGNQSFNALKAYFRVRPAAETILLRGLNCLQGARYIALAEGRGKNEDFLNGWLEHRVSL
jgi:lysozyme family protein